LFILIEGKSVIIYYVELHEINKNVFSLYFNRYLFYSEWERPANISRVNLDATGLVVFQKLILGWPNGLAIDYEEDRLYWCDALLDHIQHSKLDGTDVQTVFTSLIRHAFSLVVYEGWCNNKCLKYASARYRMLFMCFFLEWLYITDWRLDAIVKVHKKTGDREKIIEEVEQTNRLYGIKIFSSKAQQIDYRNPCIRAEQDPSAKCQKFCFAVPPANKTVPEGQDYFLAKDLVARCDCPAGEVLING
jgi:low density lipoprotein-related protein 2